MAGRVGVCRFQHVAGGGIDHDRTVAFRPDLRPGGDRKQAGEHARACVARGAGNRKNLRRWRSGLAIPVSLRSVTGTLGAAGRACPAEICRKREKTERLRDDCLHRRCGASAGRRRRFQEILCTAQ